MKEPDYDAMPLADLLDVEQHINRDLVPERWAKLQIALAKRRSGTNGEPLAKVPEPIGPMPFMFLHMITTAVILVVLLVATPSRGEGAVGRDLALFLVVPAAFFLSALSVVFHPLFLRSRNPRRYLLVSVLVTPFASVAVLVLGSSLLFALGAVFSH